MFGDFDTAVVFDNIHFLLEGMQLTLVLTVVAILGGWHLEQVAGQSFLV